LSDSTLIDRASDFLLSPEGNEWIPAYVPENAEATTGYASEMVSAVLETLGLLAQSQVLDDIGPLITSLGVLAFILGAIGGVLSVALYGNYKSALVLLVSPALFLWLLQARVPATGVGWAVGSHVIEKNPNRLLSLFHINDAATYTDGGTPEVPHVSTAFAIFARVTSSVVRSVTELLIDTSEGQRDHIVFLAREQMLKDVLSREVADHEFLQLLAWGQLGECGALQVKRHELQRAEKQLADFERTGSFVGPQGQAVTSSQALENRVQRLQEQVGVLEQHRIDLSQKPQVLAYVQRLLDWTPSEEAGDDLQAHAGYEQQQIHWFTAPFVEEFKEGLGELPVVQCGDVWRYVAIGTFVISQRAFFSSYWEAQYPDWPWWKIRLDVQKAILRSANAHFLSLKPLLEGQGDEVTEEQALLAAQIIAATILKNTMGNSQWGALISSVESRSRWDPDMYGSTFGSAATAEREGRRIRLYHFAGSIPYIQATLLFLLAMLFPFFAIFILLPGKVEAFFMWFGLWMWVKSWDVGFAIVHFFRDFLWTFMDGDIRKSSVEALDWTAPESVLQVMFEGDPLNHLNTYYSLISILTLAVPFITAHLFYGASDVVGAFAVAIDKSSAEVGDRKARASRRMPASRTERGYQQQEADSVKAAQQALKDNVERGSGITLPMDGRAVGEAGGRDADEGRHLMDAAAGMAKMRYRFSEAGIRQHNNLAALTGRKMSIGIGTTNIGSNYVKYAGWMMTREHQYGEMTRGVRGLSSLLYKHDPRTRIDGYKSPSELWK